MGDAGVRHAPGEAWSYGHGVRVRAKAAGALAAGVLAAAVGVVAGIARDDRAPQRQQKPASNEDVRAGAVPEARPFTVPTTTPTDPLHVHNPSMVLSGDRPRSVPWQLIRVWDGGRRLAIQYGPGCSSPDTGQVRFEESPTDVLVQTLADPRSKRCLRNVRVALALSRPLGSRQLLHAATRPAAIAPDRRTLAERYENAPDWPAPPWFKAGHEVPLSVLTLWKGPEHCNWQRATYLGGSGLGNYRDSRGNLWVRDPHGVLEHFPVARRDFRARATLPSDATASGFEQADVELWTAASDRGNYVYLVNRHDRRDVERWVRGGGLCA